MSYENLTCWADNGRCRLADIVEEQLSNIEHERERRETAEARVAELEAILARHEHPSTKDKKEAQCSRKP